jgi:sulfite oxidase
MGGGGRAVERVEVSSDGGRSWAPAQLVGPGGPWTWRLWRADVAVPTGACEVVVRAVDDSGGLQPEHVSWAANPRGYLNNAWPRLSLD